MNQEILLQDAKQYVTRLFEAKTKPSFYFHNITHTGTVVRAAEDMADHYRLADHERLALLLAAWFHDTGYTQAKARDHEEESVAIAESFLTERNVNAPIIEQVGRCIMATRMPQDPHTLLEQIICDADLSHLGGPTFKKENRLLRKELAEVHGKDISKKEWRRENIRFLEAHRYFTDFANERYEPLKQEHLAVLRAAEDKTDTVAKSKKKDLPDDDDTDAEDGMPEVKDRLKENRTERGVGIMFRIMSDNHVSLSQMADSKANIMISVNTIVLSILVSVLLGKLQFYPQFIIPTILLASVCLLAIVFAILATRPNVTRGTFSKQDVQQKKVNLLFFGNFHKMDLPDYDWGMNELMNDKEYLYSSMIKDIYFLGKVLAKKYKYLRLSYTIFMFGLVIAMAAFILATILS